MIIFKKRYFVICLLILFIITVSLLPFSRERAAKTFGMKLVLSSSMKSSVRMMMNTSPMIETALDETEVSPLINSPYQS